MIVRSSRMIAAMMVRDVETLKGGGVALVAEEVGYCVGWVRGGHSELILTSVPLDGLGNWRLEVHVLK